MVPGTGESVSFDPIGEKTYGAPTLEQAGPQFDVEYLAWKNRNC
jgi:hypothetical protein